MAEITQEGGNPVEDPVNIYSFETEEFDCKEEIVAECKIEQEESEVNIGACNHPDYIEDADTFTIKEESPEIDTSQKVECVEVIEELNCAQYSMAIENLDPLATTQDECTAVEALRQLSEMHPEHPCEPCDSQFQTSTELQNHMIDCKRPISPYHICSVCGERFERRVDLGNHIVCHQVERPYACSICGNLFPHKGHLQNHMKCHQVSRPYKCALCGADFQRLSSLTNHMKIHAYSPGRALTAANSNQTNSEDIQKVAETMNICSPRTNKTFVERWNVKCDNRANTGPSVVNEDPLLINKLSDSTCEITSNYQPNLFSLPLTSHYFYVKQSDQRKGGNLFESCVQPVNEPQVDCFVQTNSEPKEDPLDRNPPVTVKILEAPTKQKEALKRPHVCLYCGKMFSRVKALASHISLHKDLWGDQQVSREVLTHPLQQDEPKSSPSTMYTCMQCIKSFSTKQKLVRHMWVHRKKSYMCGICDVILSDKVSLDEHRLTHHQNLSPFSCNTCGKSFASRQGLWEHGRTHDSNSANVFGCQSCNKNFSSRQGYIIHMRSHTGERPYGCRYCSKAFRDGGTLRKHERIHTGERPHCCPLCHKKFNQKVVLREHVRWVHAAKDNLFSCQLCHKVLQDREELSSHLVQHSDRITTMVKTIGAQSIFLPAQPIVDPALCAPSSSEDTNHCDMCAESFQSRIELLQHVKIHI